MGCLPVREAAVLSAGVPGRPGGAPAHPLGVEAAVRGPPASRWPPGRDPAAPLAGGRSAALPPGAGQTPEAPSHQALPHTNSAPTALLPGGAP